MGIQKPWKDYTHLGIGNAIWEGRAAPYFGDSDGGDSVIK